MYSASKKIRPSFPIHEAVKERNREKLKDLLTDEDNSNLRVHVNQTDSSEETPLSLAVRNKDEEACKILLEHGAHATDKVIEEASRMTEHGVLSVDFLQAIKDKQETIEKLSKLTNITKNKNQYFLLIEDFDLKNDNKITKESHSFYTGYPGYKFKVKLYVQEDISASVQLVQGQFDGMLNWPCREYFRLEIVELPRLEDSSPVVYDVGWHRTPENQKHCFEKPQNEANTAFGPPFLLSKEEAKKYIFYGNLLMRITVIKEDFELDKIAKLSKKQKGALCQENQRLWLIETVQKRWQNSQDFLQESPNFYTLVNTGYHFTVILHLSDYSTSADDANVAVYFQLAKGRFDKQISWPCQNNFKIELVKWTDFDKVSPAVGEISWSRLQEDLKQDNYFEFGPVNLITQHEALTDGYLLQDNFLIRVTIREEGFELTKIAQLLNIEKQELTKENEKFWLIEDVESKCQNASLWQQESPYFYTSSGYNFRLMLDMNDQEDEEEEPVLSIYFQLAKGRHDEDIAWPCQQAFKIELVKWTTFNQESPAVCKVSWSEASEDNKGSFEKPGEDTGSCLAFKEILTQEAAFSDDYIRDGNFLVRVTF